MQKVRKLLQPRLALASSALQRGRGAGRESETGVAKLAVTNLPFLLECDRNFLQ